MIKLRMAIIKMSYDIEDIYFYFNWKIISLLIFLNIHRIFQFILFLYKILIKISSKHIKFIKKYCLINLILAQIIQFIDNPYLIFD